MRVLRPLGMVLIAAWSLLILVWLALHWIILPHIDQWREPIERRASQMLGQTVRIGEVIVTSSGWVPALELHSVELLDAQATPALRLPRVVAALSVHSLLTLQPRFEQLFIDGAHLEMRRDQAGHLFIAGLDVSGGDGGDPTLANWFFKQHEFVIRGGTLRWTDEMHTAEPLSLTDVQLVVRNSLRRHDLRIDATPPAEWGERFTLMAHFTQPLLAPSGDWRRWKGTLYANLPLADVGTLRQHATLPFDLDQGQGALRAWINVDAGQPDALVLDVALRDVALRLRPGLEALGFSEATGRVTGRHTAQGSELAARQLGFVTGDGVRWPASNMGLSWRQRSDGSPIGGEFSAERLDLALVSRLAQRLPIEPELRERLDDLDPQGIVEGLNVRWDGVPPAPSGAAAAASAVGLPAHYQLRVAVKGLALNARPASQPDLAGRPGVRQADLEIQASEKGGEAHVSMANGALDLPGVLDEPVLPLDRLNIQLGWRLGATEAGTAPSVSVQIKQAQFGNADLQAEFRGSWSTGSATARSPGPRFPGALDIDGTLSQVVGTRVARYLPLGVGPNSRHYVEYAVRAGRVPQATFHVKGDLDQFPFAHARNAQEGEFSIVAQVEDATLAYVPSRPATDTQPAFVTPWLPLEELGGELRFDRVSMEIRNAKGRIQGIKFSNLQGGIKSLEDHSVMQLEAAGRGTTADLLRFINSSPVAGWTGNSLALASGGGNADLKLSMALPLSRIETSTVRGSVTLGGGELRLRPDVPLLSATRGRIDFTQKGFSIVGGAARMLGGEFSIDGGPQPDGSTRFTGQGIATAEGLRRGNDALGPVLARLATSFTGQTPYRMTLGMMRGKTDLLVTSNLVGLASDLPAPFQKTADASLPLRYQVSPLADAGAAALRDTMRLDLTGLLQTQFVRDVSGETPRVLRGGIGVLEPAPQPVTGVAAALNLPHVNLDPWERLFDSTKVLPAGGAAPGDAAGGGYFPTTIALRAQELQWGRRRLSRLVAGLSQEGPLWRVNVDAEQVSGYIEYRSPRAAAGSAGRVYARLARLSLPRDELADVESLLDPVAVSVPALDIVVEDFMLRGKSLGRMEMEAVNRGSGEGRPEAQVAREWRLTKLSLTTPEARLSASGNWAALGAGSGAAAASGSRRVVLNFKLELDDSGALLDRLGYGKVLRGGKGAMGGQLAWVGSPLSLDFPSLSGQVNLAMASGQFLKADPGVGRLLGVLSLQSLPRRFLLDFRDVFQQGFAFDDISGDLQIAQGVAKTNNLRMRGVQAAVLMEGHADIAQETQDLRVVVVPELNAGTASLAYAAINPALGLGSFLAQALLRKPLMAANTREFHVTGPWMDPKVEKIDHKSADEAPASAPPAASAASAPGADIQRVRP